MNSGQQAKFGSVTAPFSGDRAKPQQGSTRPQVPHPAPTLAHPPGVELVDAHGFLASPVWPQVRPRRRAPSEARPDIKASSQAKARPGLVGVPDVGPLCPLTSTPPMTTAQAASLVSFPGPWKPCLVNSRGVACPAWPPRKEF